MADLVKVTFDYSNGTYKTLEGEELEKWMRFNAQVAGIASLHGVEPPYDKIKWNKIGPEKHY